MRSRYALAIIALATTVGCARRAPAPKPVVKPTMAAKTLVPLPDWAPKHPSPEFLRAARVLKPITWEALAELAAGNEATKAAMRVNMRATCTVQYELFGTLTDQQIAHFVKTKQVRVAARSIRLKQREVMDRFFAVWRQNAAQGHERDPDFLVLLYKRGAKEDLSNVDFGFITEMKSRIVRVIFWMKTPGGEVPQQAHAFAAI